MLLADATGHGVQAALMTTAIHALYGPLKYSAAGCAATLGELNRLYFESFATLGVFFSAVALEIDLGKRRITFASAGHETQFLVNAGKALELYTPNRLVGIAADSVFVEDVVEMPDTGTILLYSDGLSEASNAAFEQFSVERIKDLALEGSARGLPRRILDAVDAHRAGHPFSDDLTMLVISFKATRASNTVVTGM